MRYKMKTIVYCAIHKRTLVNEVLYSILNVAEVCCDIENNRFVVITDMPEAVSYTHLDVYKRQVQDRAGTLIHPQYGNQINIRCSHLSGCFYFSQILYLSLIHICPAYKTC